MPLPDWQQVTGSPQKLNGRGERGSRDLFDLESSIVESCRRLKALFTAAMKQLRQDWRKKWFAKHIARATQREGIGVLREKLCISDPELSRFKSGERPIPDNQMDWFLEVFETAGIDDVDIEEPPDDERLRIEGQARMLGDVAGTSPTLFE